MCSEVVVKRTELMFVLYYPCASSFQQTKATALHTAVHWPI